MLYPGPALFPSANVWPSYQPPLAHVYDSGGAAPPRRKPTDDEELVALTLALI